MHIHNYTPKIKITCNYKPKCISIITHQKYKLHTFQAHVPYIILYVCTNISFKYMYIHIHNNSEIFIYPSMFLLQKFFSPFIISAINLGFVNMCDVCSMLGCCGELWYFCISFSQSLHFTWTRSYKFEHAWNT